MKITKLVILVILGFVSLACDKDKSSKSPIELINFLPDGDPLPADPGPTQDDQGQDQDQDDGQPDLGQNDPNPPVDPCAVAVPDPDQCTTPPVIVEPYRYSGGRGTSVDPYLIANPEDLRRIADNPSAAFKIINNINMEYETFQTLPKFTGFIHGGGGGGGCCTIYNLSITYETSDTPIVAMFEEVAGHITQMTLSSLNVVGSGRASGVAGILSGTISQSRIYGKVVSPADVNEPYPNDIRGHNPVYGTKTSTGVLINVDMTVYFNGLKVRQLFDPSTFPN